YLYSRLIHISYFSIRDRWWREGEGGTTGASLSYTCPDANAPPSEQSGVASLPAPPPSFPSLSTTRTGCHPLSSSIFHFPPQPCYVLAFNRNSILTARVLVSLASASASHTLFLSILAFVQVRSITPFTTLYLSPVHYVAHTRWNLFFFLFFLLCSLCRDSCITFCRNRIGSSLRTASGPLRHG
ncbi:hypothetical protein B0H19DRAFT_1365567, partial [Mycena capillaripes]